jgi:hypothetical protein
MTGQPVPAAAQVEARKWIVENHDVESGYRYWRDGKLGFGEWLGSFRGVREGAWFAWVVSAGSRAWARKPWRRTTPAPRRAAVPAA